MRRFSFLSLLLFLLVGALMPPVLSAALSWLQFDSVARAILREMAQTVLPQYALTSLLLCVRVALGVAVVGMATASAVTLFEFLGRRVFEWGAAVATGHARLCGGLRLFRLFEAC